MYILYTHMLKYIYTYKFKYIFIDYPRKNVILKYSYINSILNFYNYFNKNLSINGIYLFKIWLTTRIYSTHNHNYNFMSFLLYVQHAFIICFKIYKIKKYTQDLILSVGDHLNIYIHSIIKKTNKNLFPSNKT